MCKSDIRAVSVTNVKCVYVKRVLFFVSEKGNKKIVSSDKTTTTTTNRQRAIVRANKNKENLRNLAPLKIRQLWWAQHRQAGRRRRRGRLEPGVPTEVALLLLLLGG